MLTLKIRNLKSKKFNQFPFDHSESLSHKGLFQHKSPVFLFLFFLLIIPILHSATNAFYGDKE